MSIRRNHWIVLSIVTTFFAPATAVVARPPTPSASLKIEICDNLIFVPVEINGVRTLKFVLDTGSDQSVLTDTRVTELGIPLSGEREEIIGIGNNRVEARFATNVAVKIGVFQLVVPRMTVLSLQDMNRTMGCLADGILGLDFFQRYVVDINYQRHQLRIYEPSSYKYPKRATVIPLTINPDGIFVNIAVALGQRQVTGKLFIDTGNGHSFTLSPRFVKQNDFAAVSMFLPRMVAGIGGDTNIRLGRMEYLQIGSFLLRRPTVEVSVDPASGLADGAEWGAIGGEVLRRFRVVFDYGRSKVILHPTSAYSEPFEEDMSGLALVTQGEKTKTIRVDRVYDGSPASLVQLHRNDVIMQIDGRQAELLGLEKIRTMFRKPDKTYRLLVKRSDKVFEVRFRTKRLV